MPQTVLTIFLSSTAKDLTAYREAVHARLSRIKYFSVVWQEHFDAQSAQAYDYCHDEAKKADIYVGLIGMRRGWEPKQDAANRSITELEHDWAQEAGKQRLLHIAPDTFPVPGNLRETEDQHKRQLEFRQRMMAERIVSQTSFDSPDLLASTISERLLRHVIEENRQQLLKAQADQIETLPDAIAGKMVGRVGSVIAAHGTPAAGERSSAHSHYFNDKPNQSTPLLPHHHSGKIAPSHCRIVRGYSHARNPSWYELSHAVRHRPGGGRQGDRHDRGRRDRHESARFPARGHHGATRRPSGASGKPGHCPGDPPRADSEPAKPSQGLASLPGRNRLGRRGRSATHDVRRPGT